MMTELEAAYEGIKIAESKEQEGDLRRAHMCYETVIIDFMHLSFTECDNLASVEAWLEDHKDALEKATSRFIAMTKDVFAGPDDQLLVFFRSGNYLLLAFSHFSAVLGQHERANFFAEAAIKPELQGTPFWTEYAKLYWAMMKGHGYNAVFPAGMEGSELYWLDYVHLMQAAIAHEGIEDALAEIDRQFVIRNKDKKEEDPYMIDGDGWRPVKFDFRKAGILATIENTKLRSVA